MTNQDFDDQASGFDFVMEGDSTARCVELIHEASGIENEAMNLDRLGPPNGVKAAASYRQTYGKLLEAIRECPQDHPDRSALEEHASEVAGRAAYLEALDGALASIPLEEHIHAVTLRMGQEQEDSLVLRRNCMEERTPVAAEGKKVLGAAAAIGGATGLLLMGPMSAVALGVGAAYAATREDKAGTAARKVGKAGVKAVHLGKKINDEYRLSMHALAAGQCALDQVALVGSKYGLADTARDTGKALHHWNEKHKVTHTLGWGFSTAGSALSGLVSKGGGDERSRGLVVEEACLPRQMRFRTLSEFASS
eukprot:CAMPEP_0203967108 /NCGR_PEP_ID=MMETSP0359-20131031/96174_1 /ASSEMBLY_ACC=CAM_ASM_000338 /TAXON_ID=268821 /ORGANISM="Scrippsiella Hangoei, Strain SHTV-5" /LENGTH=308 /DNA_ID=CAMNT_0050904825 /DNA_START=78 /DNA_END=1002 /DNA_ORIENTATION=-